MTLHGGSLLLSDEFYWFGQTMTGWVTEVAAVLVVFFFDLRVAQL